MNTKTGQRTKADLDTLCQARSEDAYYGHVVLRLMPGFVLFYTSRGIFKGHVTMEEIVFTLKHHWMMVDYAPFELYAIA